MHPPLTDAIQGGFFVAIFMTGVVFGAGALVFKEFTEGFGCLLGGFSFSMWLLTLKAGGLITNSVGKGVFIGVFCILAWALSLSSYTRPYALIGSTSFSGATAFVLGIDCFTRAGMKEFWFYIWDLNDDLFPLDTNTFPLTKGMRVEIAVIVIGTIIGVLSQIKLWKVIRTKEKVIEANQEENDRQQQAIDAALGRHLQRQNDREKSQWEKQYGDRLQSKRNTVLWQDAHPEKRYSSVSVVAVQPTSLSSPSESLEMNAFGPRRLSGYGSKNKRQSSVAVDVIEEIEEDPVVIAETERRKALQALEEVDTSAADPPSKDNHKAKTSPTAILTNYKPLAGENPTDTRKSSDPITRKRQSQQSLSSLSKRHSQHNIGASESNENLLDVERPYSRASSVAATVDEANEDHELPPLEHGEDDVFTPPAIVISPVGSETGELRSAGIHLPIEGTKLPSQSLETSELASESTALNEGVGSSNVSSTEAAEKEAPQSNKDYAQSQATGSSNSSADSLTALALSQIPSQLSNVVLSYRTNEWAKHISVAEVPICDEPETIDGSDELPTQLAKPIPEEEKKVETNLPAVEVPQAEMLPPSVKANNGGVGIATSPAVAQRSFSDPDRRKSTAKAPSRTGSMQSLKLPGHRNSRNSFDPGSTTSLVTTPIDENVPTVFAAQKNPARRVSSGPYMLPNRMSSSSSLTGPSGPRPHTSQTAATPYYHNSSAVSVPQSIRPMSQHAPIPIGTRLDSYDSRQPPRRETRSNAERRESLLAEWRLSQQQRATTSGISGAAVESSRAQMQAERENKRMTEEYLKREQQRKQQTMDQVMRRPDMQDAHREAMRRMQANANNNLRNSSA